MKKNTKELIITKFTNLVADNELHLISIRDIAKECSVTPATIYKHFESKKELLIAVFKNSAQNLEKELIMDFSTKETATSTFENLYKYSQSNKHLFKLLLNLHQCVEISNIEANDLINKYCLIKQKLLNVCNNEIVVKYFILLPFIKFCLDCNEENNFILTDFINILVNQKEVKIWK